MKNHSNSSRRQTKKGALRRAIYDAQRPSYSQVVEAKALARKLMGLPDLHSKAYASKERKAVLRINKIVNNVAISIEGLSRKNWVLVGVHKKWLTTINGKIEASNDYRKHNALLLLGIPEVQPIKWTDLNKIKNLVVVLQCNLCNRYLSNSKERKAEMCSECITNTRTTSRGNSTSPPSFTKQLLPYNSTNTRGRMDMKHKNIANMQMPKRQEVSHR